eukprot:477387-Hanusia_phi.AAC.5
MLRLLLHASLPYRSGLPSASLPYASGMQAGSRLSTVPPASALRSATNRPPPRSCKDCRSTPLPGVRAWNEGFGALPKMPE